MNKALVTAVGPSMHSILECSQPTLERYAATHDYDLIIERDLHDNDDYRHPDNKAARWARVPLMGELIMDYDLAVWFDADIMITDFERDIAEDVPPDDFQAFVLEQSPLTYRRGFNINTGVWPIRGDPESHAFIREVQKIGMVATSTWASQDAMSRVLGWEMGDSPDGKYFMARPVNPSPFLRRTSWLPVAWNPTGIAKDLPGRVIHYAGLKNDVRLDLMRQQLRKMQEEGSLD